MHPAAFPFLGLLVGIAAAFTGLGGGFLVIPLLIWSGFTPQKAVGTSFVSILVVSLSALFAHGRVGQVDWKTGALLGIGGLVGAQIGTRLLQHVGPAVFNKIFAGVLIVLALQMLLKK
jgi:uncharacterized membrane protein YfcA